MANKPPVSDRPLRLLLIDDDEDDYQLTKEVLSDIQSGTYHLDWVSDYETGVEVICRGEHDVYLIDYRIGAKTGLDLLRETRSRNCLGPMIFLTGQSLFEIDQAAMEAGASDFLEKARLDATILERSIRYAIRQNETEQELEQKVAERTASLEEANAQLRESDRQKDQFLATLAHELRNPLGPIRNALEIMRLTKNDPKKVEQVREIMDRQVRQMVRLIDDLLDVSRITRGKLRLTLEPVELLEVLRELIESNQPAIDKAGLRLITQLPSEPIRLKGDRVRLAQVFENILNNAMKYTDRGGKISLAVRKEKDRVVIQIKDTGIGIPPEILPRIFDLFAQVDRSLNRSQGGLGIGLGLVKTLVEMHKGKVTAKSEGINKGAEFLLELPLSPES